MLSIIIPALNEEQVLREVLEAVCAQLHEHSEAEVQLLLARRESVIDVGSFLNALQALGYDGPVRAEPFNQVLRDLDNDAACAATAAAITKAFALID